MTEDERLLVHWINEREQVRLRKEGGDDPPWTDDHVLQQFRFCNVKRENDRVTKWVRTHWPHEDVGLVALARMFNLPSHLEVLLKVQDMGLPYMSQVSKSLREEGHKLFNGAYLITTCGVKMDKVEYVYQVARDVQDLGWHDHFETLAETHRYLMTVNGMGSFLSAQVVADLKNTPGHPLMAAPDWWTWAAPGPGSLRGLKWATGGVCGPQSQFLADATALWERIRGHVEVPRIHMQDFQNCLCEYDKYRRVLNGGRAKQRYPGTG